MARHPTGPRIPRRGPAMSRPWRPVAADLAAAAGLDLPERGPTSDPPPMSPNERRAGAKEQRGLRVGAPPPPAERPKQDVELRGVLARHAELIVGGAAQVKHLEHRLELRG